MNGVRIIHPRANAETVNRLDGEIHVGTRPLSASHCAQRNRFPATTLLPEQPKPSQPLMIMVSLNLRFSVGMGLAGLAQLREEKICKLRVAPLGRQSNPLNFKAEEVYQRWLDRLPSTKLILTLRQPQ